MKYFEILQNAVNEMKYWYDSFFLRQKFRMHKVSYSIDWADVFC